MSNSEENGLEFQEFDLERAGATTRAATTSPIDANDDADDDEAVAGRMEHDKLLDDGSNEATGRGDPPFWSFNYYRALFDVSTADVRTRCLGSMVPLPSRNLLREQLSRRPDLYGPFWICVTLAVLTAVMGNVSSYIQTATHEGRSHWKYDFHKLSVAASILFGYAWIVPVILTTVLWWRSVQTGVSILSLICLYGYSLTVFVPVSVLCASGVRFVQVGAVLGGGAVSGLVLAINVWRALRQQHEEPTHATTVMPTSHGGRVAALVALTVLALHVLLSAAFLLYFFRASSAVVHWSNDQSAPFVPAVNASLNAGAGGRLTVAPNIVQRRAQQTVSALVDRAGSVTVAGVNHRTTSNLKPVVGGSELETARSVNSSLADNNQTTVSVS